MMKFVEKMRAALAGKAACGGRLPRSQREAMNLLLTGVEGAGKTTLSRAIVNYLQAHEDLHIIGVYLNCEWFPDPSSSHM
jgi:tRNA A37 threonylcarbamoyladenosine biosynthesis protein TsaE